ncbi:uncharacterized protein EV422DRAFT_325783 [Fimicolochytrium jonesii]|uniref:uncharacterized protein n=1 Tax=Fimicolochytrium jonesii TaxID=1396493 RepID=UPI0022FE4C1E|nr:uncharacterized protein EV422DRAFT_325783 [Fimicolochytrium jonesii]KAI8824569.1 hypothetical protein EV422DRAFT_325783 [Fimicolochytrium jonesii]
MLGGTHELRPDASPASGARQANVAIDDARDAHVPNLVVTPVAGATINNDNEANGSNCNTPEAKRHKNAVGSRTPQHRNLRSASRAGGSTRMARNTDTAAGDRAGASSQQLSDLQGGIITRLREQQLCEQNVPQARADPTSVSGSADMRLRKVVSNELATQSGSTKKSRIPHLRSDVLLTPSKASSAWAAIPLDSPASNTRSKSCLQTKNIHDLLLEKTSPGLIAAGASSSQDIDDPEADVCPDSPSYRRSSSKGKGKAPMYGSSAKTSPVSRIPSRPASRSNSNLGSPRLSRSSSTISFQAIDHNNLFDDSLPTPQAPGPDMDADDFISQIAPAAEPDTPNRSTFSAPSDPSDISPFAVTEDTPRTAKLCSALSDFGFGAAPTPSHRPHGLLRNATMPQGSSSHSMKNRMVASSPMNLGSPSRSSTGLSPQQFYGEQPRSGGSRAASSPRASPVVDPELNPFMGSSMQVPRIPATPATPRVSSSRVPPPGILAAGEGASSRSLMSRMSATPSALLSPFGNMGLRSAIASRGPHDGEYLRSRDVDQTPSKQRQPEMDEASPFLAGPSSPSSPSRRRNLSCGPSALRPPIPGSPSPMSSGRPKSVSRRLFPAPEHDDRRFKHRAHSLPHRGASSNLAGPSQLPDDGHMQIDARTPSRAGTDIARRRPGVDIYGPAPPKPNFFGADGPSSSTMTSALPPRTPRRPNGNSLRHDVLLRSASKSARKGPFPNDCNPFLAAASGSSQFPSTPSRPGPQRESSSGAGLSTSTRPTPRNNEPSRTPPDQQESPYAHRVPPTPRTDRKRKISTEKSPTPRKQTPQGRLSYGAPPSRPDFSGSSTHSSARKRQRVDPAEELKLNGSASIAADYRRYDELPARLDFDIPDDSDEESDSDKDSDDGDSDSDECTHAHRTYKKGDDDQGNGGGTSSSSAGSSSSSSGFGEGGSTYSSAGKSSGSGEGASHSAQGIPGTAYAGQVTVYSTTVTIQQTTVVIAPLSPFADDKENPKRGDPTYKEYTRGVVFEANSVDDKLAGSGCYCRQWRKKTDQPRKILGELEENMFEWVDCGPCVKNFSPIKKEIGTGKKSTHEDIKCMPSSTDGKALSSRRLSIPPAFGSSSPRFPDSPVKTSYDMKVHAPSDPSPLRWMSTATYQTSPTRSPNMNRPFSSPARIQNPDRKFSLSSSAGSKHARSPGAISPTPVRPPVSQRRPSTSSTTSGSTYSSSSSGSPTKSPVAKRRKDERMTANTSMLHRTLYGKHVSPAPAWRP